MSITTTRRLIMPYLPALNLMRTAYRSLRERQVRWSYIVEDYYPIAPRPRWHVGTAPYDKLYGIIDQHRGDFEARLDQLTTHRDLLHGISQLDVGADQPTWDNLWFTGLDAAMLVGLLAERRPRHYVEIGSGNSTRFARYTINKLRLPTQLISIDPHPRAEIDRLCTKIVRNGLEECDLTVFDSLDRGDILFLDGSHRVFSNSDVTVFFFEVMPRIKPGVLIHIHDVFLPDDYPEDWNRRLYTEQYLLAAMLMCHPPFRVVAANAFICRDPHLSQRVKAIFAGPTGDIPFLYKFRHGDHVPGSFWIEMTG